MKTPKRKIIDGAEYKLVGPVPGNRWYVPVHDRGFPDTSQTEMARLLDECAKIGRDNARLREAGGLMRAWIGDNEGHITERWDILSNVQDEGSLADGNQSPQK